MKTVVFLLMLFIVVSCKQKPIVHYNIPQTIYFVYGKDTIKQRMPEHGNWEIRMPSNSTVYIDTVFMGTVQEVWIIPYTPNQEASYYNYRTK